MKGGLVHRSRLFEQLARGQRARLTLVVGSPGAGKTALLADWVTTRPERPLAWLSCDVADADPVRFIAAVIEALQRAPGRSDVGEDARQLLSLDGEVSADVIAALADDLERQDGAGVLVIDDFHLTGGAGTDALALLLEYSPPSLQLVVASRVDPQLRLYRMRANQELVELRGRGPVLLSGGDRNVPLQVRRAAERGDLAAVHRRSEGWAAGLQMAAISINQSVDASSAAGRVELHRHSVAGYFLDEVLYRQPPEVVDFMLATSILDELSVPACTALCGQGSAVLLQLAYGAHLFVTILDEEAGTSRYHQLIKEVLHAELHGRDPARERLLHTTAAAYLARVWPRRPGGAAPFGCWGPGRGFSPAQRAGRARLLCQARLLAVPSTWTSSNPTSSPTPPKSWCPWRLELLLRGAFERGSRAFTLAQ